MANELLDRSKIKSLKDLALFVDMARNELLELNTNIAQTMTALQNILRIVGIKCEELSDGLNSVRAASDMGNVENTILEESEE